MRSTVGRLPTCSVAVPRCCQASLLGWLLGTFKHEGVVPQAQGADPPSGGKQFRYGWCCRPQVAALLFHPSRVSC